MKGISEVISVAFLILIAFALALIIYVWGRDFVAFILGNSYNSYMNYRNSSVMGSIVNFIFSKT
jgi:flagellin-like protein